MGAPRTPAQPDWRFDVGGTVITGTATVTGAWRAVQTLTDCTFAAGTAVSDLVGGLSGVQASAGCLIHGRFTAVQLSSGSAVAYR